MKEAHDHGHDHGGEECDDHDELHDQVPEGAAVMPLIPAELGIHPLLLATVHSVVFFDSSAEEVVNEPAANEALSYLATYLQRLKGDELRRVREDLDTLIGFGREEEWPADVLKYLSSFLEDFGVKAK
jgi:hypothetical protein